MGRLGSLLARAAMLAVILAGLGAVALAWRLSQGPISFPAATEAVREELVRQARALGPGLDVRLDAVSLAWAGWGGSEPLPIAVRVEGLHLRDAAGVERAVVPVVEAWLSVVQLLRGVVAPTRIAVRGPIVMLRRAEYGSVALDLEGAAPAAGERAEEPVEGADPEIGAAMLRDLLGSPPPDSVLVALREIVVADATVRVRDDPLGIAWTLGGADVTVRRAAGQGVEASGRAVFRLGGESIPVSLSARAAGDPAVVEGSLDLPSISPAALSRTLPALRPMEALDAPVSARFSGRYAFGDGALAARAEVTAGAGAVVSGGRPARFDSLSVTLSTDGSRVRLEGAEVRARPARPGAPSTRIVARGEAARAGEAWRGRAEVSLDAVAFGDLGSLWPPGLADGARDWMAENITAGTARDGAWWAEAEANGDLSNVRLLGAGGTVRATGMTVHWLRPIPPAEGADAVATFSPTEIAIAVRGGRQSGTGLAIRDGPIRITGLGAAERIAMELRVGGPLADMIGLLKHPRLHLFDRRPLDLKEPSGTLEGTVNLAFPLVADLPVERITVSAAARVTNGRLADFVAGLPLERANLDLSVDPAGMRLSGTANLGPIPTTARAELDFRPGPPGQVTERVRAEGRTDAASLAAFGVETDDIVTGPIGYVAEVERRRNGETTVALRGDLRGARLDLERIGYVKRAGTAGTAEGTLRVQGDTARSLDGVRVTAPDFLFRGGLTFGPRARLTRVEIAEARIGRGQASGTVIPPTGPGAPYRVTLRGPYWDARAILDMPETSGPGRGGGRSPPLVLDLRFDRALLYDGREVAPVAATASVDARGVLRELRASGRAGGGPFDVAIAPRGTGRMLDVASNDAGAFLRGMNLFEDMVGGRMRVIATWASDAPGAPLTGTAEITDFSVRNAPAVGKFLQALTVYGIADAASGPGLNFSRLIAPFTFTPEAVTLDGAQAFSASLGITARGRVLRRTDTMEMQGTVVPAYVFNSLLGRLPLIGRLFSAEEGGGLFSVTYRATGPISDPTVSVNPLSALTPGALRGLFSAIERPDPVPAR